MIIYIYIYIASWAPVVPVCQKNDFKIDKNKKRFVPCMVWGTSMLWTVETESLNGFMPAVMTHRCLWLALDDDCFWRRRPAPF